MLTPDQFSFFLDSGAYSAWSRGASIDLDEYCAFIKANSDHIEVYANLDVISGQPGRMATPAEVEEGARRSWENFEYMCSEGLDPLPVFHAGEDWKWLDKMLAAGCDYIGLGGLVGLGVSGRRRWMDEVFLRITDSEGWPIVKVHGFGMTSVSLIFRYPWYSVDSASWLQSTMNGSVLLPAVRAGEFIFDEPPTAVAVSDRNDKPKVIPPSMREVFLRWLTLCGKTEKEVATHYYHRAVCNVLYFQRLAQEKKDKPFDRKAKRQRGFL